jgi:2-keto-4-pentenoate hydratase/2-oxohepta-3-ene-1,7-dioic acid hydratase in catechol pathway
MVFPIAFLVSYLSQCMTLYPGDVISAGTPGGIGPMKVGDTVEVKIEGIGSLRNRIRAA